MATTSMKAAGLLHVLAAFLLAFLAGYAARQNWSMPNSAASFTRSEYSIVCLEVSTIAGGFVWWQHACDLEIETTCHVSFVWRGDYFIYIYLLWAIFWTHPFQHPVKTKILQYFVVKVIFFCGLVDRSDLLVILFFLLFAMGTPN